MWFKSSIAGGTRGGKKGRAARRRAGPLRGSRRADGEADPYVKTELRGSWDGETMAGGREGLPLPIQAHLQAVRERGV